MDKARQQQIAEPTVNNICWLFHVLAKNEKREVLVKLGRCRHSDRSNVDSALNMIDSIFFGIQPEFNYESLTGFVKPERAALLHTDINLNDIDRIKILCDHKWLKKLYLEVIKYYNKAMRRWKRGTSLWAIKKHT